MKIKKNMAVKGKINYQDIKSVEATYFRNNMANLSDQVVETGTPLYVTKRNGKDVVILDVDYFEDYLCSINPKFLKEIQKSREDFKKGRYFTLEEVFKKHNIK